jgi:hypothetical protein
LYYAQKNLDLAALLPVPRRFLDCVLFPSPSDLLASHFFFPDFHFAFSKAIAAADSILSDKP